MAKDPIVIIGGGRATASLIDAYRDAGGDALITIISDDEYPPYNRPPLSKAVLRGEMEGLEALVHEHETYDDLAVELRLATTVESVDPKHCVVRTGSGEEIAYGTLVIASGTRPRLLAVEGADLPAVHTFRTLSDAVAVAKEAGEARKALVVGGSFIGAEVAASLRMRGLEVTIVEMGDRLVPALASQELSDQVAELYREHGVEIALGEQIEEFRANGLMLTGARTASGRTIEAFLAVVGVGVVPNVEFLDGSGLELSDGITVDDRFHSSAPDVFAIGDVARFDDAVAGRPRRIEHWGNADSQGAHLGRNLAGGRKPYREVSAFFTKMFDVQLQLLGDTDGVDEVVLRGSIGDRNLVALYLREETLIAAAVVGQAADMIEELRSLVGERPALSDRSRLANSSVRPAAVFAH
ncbi:FAD/NAD(P)-binding oxidoreductase [Gaiella sp.]|uniref:NAD(P)/FAD-dependent oxidoreductase n=1 Tax=Gaiella sp. TaxID=2663207 RepID=UPI0032654630